MSNFLLTEVLTRLTQSIETTKQRVEVIYDTVVDPKVPPQYITWKDKAQIILLTSVITLVMMYLFRKY